MSKRTSWKRKLLFALAGCASVGALLIVVGLAVTMWATSVADDLGPPTPVPTAVIVAVAAEVSPAIDIALGPAGSPAGDRSRGRAIRCGRPPAEANRLTVSIPPDRPLALVLRVRQGESRIEPGGLTLTDLDAELSMGDHRLGFGTPLTQAVPQIRVDSRMGNVELAGLGNARA